MAEVTDYDLETVDEYIATGVITDIDLELISCIIINDDLDVVEEEISLNSPQFKNIISKYGIDPNSKEFKEEIKQYMNYDDYAAFGEGDVKEY